MGKVENRPFKWSVPDGADDAVTERMNQTALFIRIAICRFCLERERKRYRCVWRKAKRLDTVFFLEVTPGFEPPWGGLASC